MNDNNRLFEENEKVIKSAKELLSKSKEYDKRIENVLDRLKELNELNSINTNFKTKKRNKSIKKIPR